jgi:hypothetical protein
MIDAFTGLHIDSGFQPAAQACHASTACPSTAAVAGQPLLIWQHGSYEQQRTHCTCQPGTYQRCCIAKHPPCNSCCTQSLLTLRIPSSARLTYEHAAILLHCAVCARTKPVQVQAHRETCVPSPTQASDALGHVLLNAAQRWHSGV